MNFIFVDVYISYANFCPCRWNPMLIKSRSTDGNMTGCAKREDRKAERERQRRKAEAQVNLFTLRLMS